MTPVFETNVPLPRPIIVKYDFLDPLLPGESVHITEPINRASLKSCIQFRQVRYGKKFSLRVQPDGSIRVWRVR